MIRRRKQPGFRLNETEARNLPNGRAGFYRGSLPFVHMPIGENAQLAYTAGQKVQGAIRQDLRREAGSGRSRTPGSHNRATARKQTDDEEYDRDDEQHVDERTDRIRADDAQ